MREKKYGQKRNGRLVEEESVGPPEPRSGRWKKETLKKLSSL